ncbi:MAG: Asp-tRNA(Asn)/Glu-tRNA(Gln) amidotransferase subunit GatA [Pyrinomonadaceae bacterium]
METKETIRSLREAFIAGTDTPSAALERAFGVIDARNKELNAYLEVYEDAIDAAKRADEAYKKGEHEGKPLLGIPLALKNNILVKGKKATAASKILENYVATYDATVTKRLVDAGAIVIGSTNLDEFAMGSSTENSAFGPTRNPIDPSRVPGGSSGGSAAAVAMGSVPIALGTDTGGSIRLPASFCGIVGMKPTYGRVSRSGLIAMGSSLDQAGPFAHTVEDARLVYEIMKGEDALDTTTYKDSEYPAVEKKEKYRIGVPRAFLKGIEPDVMKVFEEAETRLRNEGHEIVDVDLPMMEEGLSAYYIVMPAEVSSNLARYDGVRYGMHVDQGDLIGDYGATRAKGFGREVKLRILLGTYVLSSGYYDAFYGKAERIRAVMRAELASAFETVDCILTPTAPMPAFRVGEKSDPLSMYLADIFTVPANLTGVPAISIPAGTVARDGVNLPIGIQFMAPHNGEDRLFDIAERFTDAS